MARRRSHRKRRAPFSKRQKAAIIRISQAPVETKRYDENWEWGSLLVTAGYISGSVATIRGQVFQSIPRADSALTKTEKEFIGSEIMLRGLRWEFMMYPNTAGATPDIRFRLTVFSTPAVSTGFPAAITGSVYADPDFNTVPTWFRWNQQLTKIRFQRTWMLGQSSDGPGNIKRKYYIPLQRKMTSAEEESTVTSSTFGAAKQIQFYWVLEVLAPTYTALNTALTGYVQTSTYFKDA